MKKVSVVSNNAVSKDNVLITFCGKTEAQQNGPFSIPSKQVTFYMWSNKGLKEGHELEFDVIKRDGRKMTKIQLIDVKSKTYLDCDVVYQKMEPKDDDGNPKLDDDGNPITITLKYLEVTDMGVKGETE